MDNTDTEATAAEATAAEAIAVEATASEERRIAAARRNHVVTIVVAMELAEQLLNSILSGIRTVYTDQFAGERILRDLKQQPLRMRRFCRFTPVQFDELYEILSLQDGYEISGEQKLLLFLHIVAQNRSYRDVAETFHHALSTISKLFHTVLLELVRLHKVVVRPAVTEDAEELYWRPKRWKYWPYFKDAVGSLDGSHIYASCSLEDAYRYRNRKGQLTQNVLAVVDHRRMFTFVLPGWEGSAHDGRVLSDAVHRHGFSAPEGKYYLADAGYSNSLLTLTPYRGVRYHLREVWITGLKPESLKELFNLRHSSLRNVVERTFGIFKRRFQIFEAAPPFSSLVQARLVYACTALHNFLTSHGAVEPIPEFLYDENNHYTQYSGADNILASTADTQRTNMDIFRNELAERMWIDYIKYNRVEEPDEPIPTNYEHEFRPWEPGE